MIDHLERERALANLPGADDHHDASVAKGFEDGPARPALDDLAHALKL